MPVSHQICLKRGGGGMSCLNFLQFIWRVNGLEEPREICGMRHMRIFRK